MPSDSHKTPPWISRTLAFAALYNLVWGAAVVLLPEQTSQLAGFDPPPRYIELWQCIGMIVGVYGVGYWIASRDPVTHWPIILVGLLGKIFGPVGLAVSLWRGTLPAEMLGTIVFNDLIWWVPFALTLWHAATEHSRIRAPVRPSEKPSQTLRDQYGKTLAELAEEAGVLVVFLRHAGCTFCREAIADIAAIKDELLAASIAPVFVHMGDETAVGKFEKHGLQDASRFSDPGRQLYREFELEIGSLGQLFGPHTFIRGIKAAILDGHGFGVLEGNGLQMPGVFLIRNGEIVTAYRHQAASDRPDYTALLRQA